MNSAKRAVQALQLSARMMSTSQLSKNTRPTASSVTTNNNPMFIKLKKDQERFQIDDGLPVHLKGGILDKFLYHLTMGLCVVGVGMCFKFYYDMATPKKE